MRARYAPEGLAEQKVIFEAKPLIPSTKHFGSRFAWGRDGTLYLTMGERSTRRELAQDLSTHLGKVLRITTDGAAPPDNPFVGRDGVQPEIFSYGHRNPQGLAINPATGEIWEQEHGARGGDEINVLKPGANYGWPEVAYGVNYSGTTIGSGRQTAPGVESPLFYWDPSIAPSGMMFYTGDRFPGWKGDLLVGALKFELVSRLDLDADNKVVKEERFLEGELGRIRDIREGPDGLVYIVTDENPGGVYRLERRRRRVRRLPAPERWPPSRSRPAWRPARAGSWTSISARNGLPRQPVPLRISVRSEGRYPQPTGTSNTPPFTTSPPKHDVERLVALPLLLKYS